MFGSFFGTQKYTQEDLLEILLSKQFDEEKISKAYKSGLSLQWTNKQKESYLHLCAKENKPASLQWLLKHGADIEAQTTTGQTPIFYAVKYGSFESTELLIGKSADFYVLDYSKRTPLQEAVKYDQEGIVQHLLKYPNDINNVDKDGHTILYDAISTMNERMVDLVLSISKLDLNHKDLKGNTILFSDNVNVNSAVIEKLIDKGIDLTIKNKDGLDYIFYAVLNRIITKEILQKALSWGYNINTICKGKSLLLTLMGMKNADVELIELLLSKNISVEGLDENDETLLFKTVKKNDFKNTQLFLNRHEININHKNSLGNTVLVYCALQGRKAFNTLNELLKHGANPNIADNSGATLIEKLINIILYQKNQKPIDEELLAMINQEEDYLEVFKMILDNSRVFLRKLNSKGKPLFFDTVFFSNKTLFKLLQANGADINHKDKEGRNILHNLLTMTDSPVFKEQKSFHRLLHELIYYGADVNSQDAHGSTTAHNAILSTNEHTVKVLLDSKANIQAQDNQGRSLIHNCVWDSKLKHFKLLQNYNDKILNMPDNYGILPINYAAFIGHTDLVLEMITARAHVNNSHKKNEKVVAKFRQFYQNVYNLSDGLTDDFEKKNVEMLIKNMKREFKLPEPKAV